METKMTILAPNQLPREVVIELDEEPGWDTLKGILNRYIDDCPFPEHVRVFSEKGEYVSIFVDDLGVPKGLALNPEATTEYQRNVLFHAPDSELAKDMPSIYGTAVLFNRNVWF